MVWSDLAKYLTKRFGLGEIPTASRRLYARLEREAEKYGDPVRELSPTARTQASLPGVIAGFVFARSSRSGYGTTGICWRPTRNCQGSGCASSEVKCLRRSARKRGCAMSNPVQLSNSLSVLHRGQTCREDAE